MWAFFSACSASGHSSHDWFSLSQRTLSCKLQRFQTQERYVEASHWCAWEVQPSPVLEFAVFFGCWAEEA